MHRPGRTARAPLLPLGLVVVIGSLLVAACGDDENRLVPATSVTGSSLEGHTWVVDVGGLGVAAAGARPTATFEDGRISGSTGCNQYNGTFTTNGSAVELGPLAMTSRACPPAATAIEDAFLARMARVGGYSVSTEQLQLLDRDGKAVLTFRIEPTSVEGDWTATGVLVGDGVVSVASGTEQTATFGDDGTVTGSGGCNRFTGGYTVSGSDIEIGPLASTRMACGDAIDQQEQAYFAALETSTSFDRAGADLTLRDGQPRTTVTFQRAG